VLGSVVTELRLREHANARYKLCYGGLDEAVLRVLGFGDVEIDYILDFLYPALANEIE